MQAPGALIKPKNDKARGRPRLPTIVYTFLLRTCNKTTQFKHMIAFSKLEK